MEARGYPLRAPCGWRLLGHLNPLDHTGTPGMRMGGRSAGTEA
jgi:hypothetical protein